MSDLLSTKSKRRFSSDMAGYRRLRNFTLRPVVLALFTIAFAIYTYWQWATPQEPAEATWSALRTAEVELTAASHADHWPGWVCRLAEIEGEEETVASLRKGFKELDAKGLLTDEGKEALAAFEELGSAKAEGEGLEPHELRSLVQDYPLVWEWLTIREQVEGSSAQSWARDELDYRSAASESLAKRALGTSLVWWFVVIVGLPFVPMALRCFKKQQHPTLRKPTTIWRPSWVTVVYFVADVVLWFALVYFYAVLPAELWERAPMVGVILGDSLWRVGLVLTMGVFLLVRWRHCFRLVGLHLAPGCKVVLGMFSLGAFYNYGLYMLLEPLATSESLLVLTSYEEGASGLVFALLSSVILAPLVEEIVFRGFLFRSYLGAMGFWFAMLLSTVLFVVTHFYGVWGSLSVAFFGIGACALYRATGSLWTAILFHALSNALIVTTMWPLYHRF